MYRMSKKLLYHYLMYRVGLFLYFVCVMCLRYTLNLKSGVWKYSLRDFMVMEFDSHI
jgi:hypothetical protein